MDSQYEYCVEETLAIAGILLAMQAWGTPSSAVVRLIGHTDEVVSLRTEIIQQLTYGKGLLGYYISNYISSLIPAKVPESNHTIQYTGGTAEIDPDRIVITLTGLTKENVEQWFLSFRHPT